MKPGLILENELEPIFLGKFPPFPENVKEFLVKYGPYFLLVGAILTLFGLLAAFGIGTAALGIGAVAYGSGFYMYVSLIIATIIMVMYLMAFSPLRARKRAGWNLLYYALILSLISNLLQLAIFAFIVGGVLGFWVLFQIREKYIL
ncbi:hypothetical protein [Dyadobacter frigoris]|uniref:Chromate transporter n=1 Tax=Dyadobacter frigoris TaxID=2576211 RepID=A0A4U6D581_9BACT|nr:hypothetical protein [Dyadobacter frigoris]TKT91575.1 hypothetical protein FDK13_14500 [Dyadobacter frigoris]GLU51866.1 hypothetical protein Dfri01_13270 [Dyadobacter frigoris]